MQPSSYDAQSVLLSMLVTFLALAFFIALVFGSVRARARIRVPAAAEPKNGVFPDLEPCKTVVVQMPCGKLFAGRPATPVASGLKEPGVREHQIAEMAERMQERHS